MRICFALSGFHRLDRGAEIALLSVARELASAGDDVTVIGSGQPRADEPYAYRRVPAIGRDKFEKFPSLPGLRDETNWEDATFAANLVMRENLRAYDVTITCGFPHTNLALRRARKTGAKHIFVTQNGDWPAFSDKSEYRLFSCDGLVCTNPQYYERNKHRWPATLIPNGVDVTRFGPDAKAGIAMRERLGLPADKPIVLMVSAFIETKRVMDGIRAVADLDDAFLVVAGDGPLRRDGDGLAADLLPGRYKRVSMSAEEMPDLYRSADMFLHLSKVKSFGNVYLEAWASGLPVVAHDYALTRWILGDEQFLCDTDNREELAAQMRAALLSSATMSNAATMAGIERFTWPVIAGQYRDFLTKTTGASTQQSRAGNNAILPKTA